MLDPRVWKASGFIGELEKRLIIQVFSEPSFATSSSPSSAGIMEKTQKMHRAFEAKIHSPYQHCAYGELFVPAYPIIPGAGHQPVQRLPSGHTFELRDEHQAEALVVVAVARVVVVAISRPAVMRIVVPRATAHNTVRTHG